jgi:sugar phosphate isomerase/epimerase
VPIRLAASTICFRRAPIETALHEIRAAGLTAIDLAVIPEFCPHFDAATASANERQRFVELIRSSGFTFTVLTSVPGHFNAPGADFDTIVAAGRANIDLAAELGIGAVNLHAGMAIDDRTSFLEQAKVQARGQREIAKHAAGCGLRINIEAPHRNGLARTVAEAEYLLEEIGEPNVDFLLDVTHIQAGGARLDDTVRRWRGRIGYVHLRDGKGENIFFVPGDGDIDFAGFLAALDETGYAGWCALELETPREELQDRRKDLRRALSYLRNDAGMKVSEGLR